MGRYDHYPRIKRWFLCFWYGHLPVLEYRLPFYYCPRCQKRIL